MTIREAAQAALDVLRSEPSAKKSTDEAEAILRAALQEDRCRKCGGPIHPNFPCEEVARFDPDTAEKHSPQTEVKPVAWQWMNTSHFRKNIPADSSAKQWRPLYLHPSGDLERLCRIMGTFDLSTGHAETMGQALDALESELRDVLGHYREANKHSDQTDAEPVAWMYVNADGECEQIEHFRSDDAPPTDPCITLLYTHPQDHDLYDVWKHGYESGKTLQEALTGDEYVCLSDEEIADIGVRAHAVEGEHFLPVLFGRAIEHAILDRLWRKK